MQRISIRGVCAFIVMARLLPCTASAQRSESGDEIIDAMRAQANLSQLDQERIADWQKKEVEALAAAKGTAKAGTSPIKTFRSRLIGQFTHAGNSQDFTKQFVVQAANLAQTRFSEKKPDGKITRALARVLVDMARSETIPALQTGLKVSDQATRYLCAKGLTGLANVIASDNAVLASVIAALSDAGIKETNPSILGRLYLALNYPDHVAAVFDAFMAIFDQRLTFRRGPSLVADGAEEDALEFFLQPKVTSTLSNDQKVQLVSRLAVFLRLDAERYATETLPFEETAKLEISLTLTERILSQIVESNKTDISKALEDGGHSKRAEVLTGAHGWVGNPKTDEKGKLNEAPWNVPIGAP